MGFCTRKTGGTINKFLVIFFKGLPFNRSATNLKKHKHMPKVHLGLLISYGHHDEKRKLEFVGSPLYKYTRTYTHFSSTCSKTLSKHLLRTYQTFS